MASRLNEEQGEHLQIVPQRTRLLIVGDAAVKTGFARVIQSIFEPLQHVYEIHHLGINYLGDPHDYPWPIYPAMNGGDRFGVGRLKALVERLRPSLVFIVYDIWTLGDYMRELADYTDPLKVVLYCPIESGPIDPAFIVRLAGAHRLVSYTQFGKQQLEQAIDQAHQHRPDLRLPPVEVIPHGVDTQRFFPLPPAPSRNNPKSGRLQARKMLWPTLTDNEDAFIVLNANRNQPRKRIDLTIEGFALFAKDKPAHVRLYLHMGVEDLGWNILKLAHRLGIDDRLILSGLTHTIPSISDEQMNLVYNACDVGLNTASSEGWGLVSFEHAATGAAQVMTGHGVTRELWQGAAELVDPALSLLEPMTLTEAHIVTPQGVADALERLYQDREYLAQRQTAAYHNAANPAYSWQQIARDWERLFAQTLTEDQRKTS